MKLLTVVAMFLLLGVQCYILSAIATQNKASKHFLNKLEAENTFIMEGLDQILSYKAIEHGESSFNNVYRKGD